MRIMILVVLSLGLMIGSAADEPRWQPVTDAVYLQEVGSQISTKDALHDVATLNRVAFVATDHGVKRVRAGELVAAEGPRGAVHRLRTIDGVLWAVVEDGLWNYMEDDGWLRMAKGAYVDVATHLDGVVVASKDTVYALRDGALEALNTRSPAAPILGIASYSESIYVRHADRLAFLEDGGFNYDDMSDWGTLPIGAETRGVLPLGSRLLVPTNEGLATLRGMNWSTLSGEDGLPYEDTTCVAEGFARDYWVGTTKGAIRVVDGAYHFFGGPRWLPDGQVNGIACTDDAVYLATDGGLAIIAYEPYTLQKKAAWYKNEMNARGMMRFGGVHEILKRDGEYVRFLSDNDIGWACHYLDALCFEYAVTGDAAVRAEAVEVFKLIKWSEEITPIPGFPARAIHAVGQDEFLASTGSAGRPSEWNLTDDGLWQWKGDTSSDEIAQQYYSVAIFYDLAAQGDEKKLAREHLARMMDHIIDNGWCLRDLDGNCTVWAQWQPDFVFSPEHPDERGLNSLQALSMVSVAQHMVGGEKYAAAKQQLIDWEYPQQILRQKIVFPWFTHFDDRLAFLSYFPMLRYEDDPDLRSLAMRSLQRSWEIKRIDCQPWFDYLYAIVTGNEFDEERAITHLREYPLDLVDYPFHNSHRDDLTTPPAGYTNYLTPTTPIGPREQGIRRWDRDPLELDQSGTMRYLDPSSYLDAYWMARYFGLILPPETEDAALLEDNEKHGPALIAPYSGPARPELGRSQL